ncbi:MAG TPA: L,D-transpeptidase [Solirubrobacteraceae bacterium]|jgi:lipoprotein-anchoring transpeptidase ErfK/SrfK|nr:L,D-transpeptidase [Solirubrobacteraceae bacterium]
MTDPAPRRPRAWLQPLAATLAAAVPLAPLVIALLLNGGGAPARATASTTRFSPVGASRPAAQTGPRVPPGSAAQTGPRLPPGSGALVALVDQRTQMRAAPGGRVIAAVPIRTMFGSPEAMWVRRLSGRWLGVVSVLAGNKRLGWIPQSDVTLSRVDWELRVSLSAHRLTVLENGRTVRRYRVAIGAPASPTPTGRFAVTDRLSTGNPAGPYGCCILALSATAPHAIQGWDGGNRIAIHSTPESSTIGEAVSHGCVRLTLAEGRWLLMHIPLGTPTVVSS